MIRARPSPRTLRALAVFGLPARRPPTHTFVASDLAIRAEAALLATPCILLTGPSGAGKSTALDLLSRAHRDRGTRTIRVRPEALRSERRTAPDLLHRGTASTLELLARCGLSDATLLDVPARKLSEGQRWRLALALALARTARDRTTPTLIIADELCAGLDELTALGVLAGAASLCARTPRLQLLATSARDDVAAMARGMIRWRVIDSKAPTP